MVNRFECVLAAVLHEDPPVVPQTIGFTNEMARSKFTPFIETAFQVLAGKLGRVLAGRLRVLRDGLGRLSFWTTWWALAAEVSEWRGR